MHPLFEYRLKRVDSPFWAFAIHDGHQISDEVMPYMRLNETERLREEDPYTATFAELPVNQFMVSTSRFQLDINRQPEDAVYLRPEQAWGLQVWKKTLPAELLYQLYAEHAAIHQKIEAWIQHSIAHYGFFVVLDIHSYNAKRSNPDDIVDTHANPQINLGTAYNHPKWDYIAKSFSESISQHKLFDGAVDIRENIKFKGGYVAQQLTQKFGEQGCVLSIEFRKDFMDEWTGIPYPPLIKEYKQLLLYALNNLQDLFKNGAR